MPTYALRIEYDGAPFRGWQRQEGGTSVQGVLEEAALRLGRGAAETVVAGRTDAGVHAAGQVVGLRLERDFPLERLAAALNFHLRPHPVAVLATAPAPPGWSARFSAIARIYRYRILNRREPSALYGGRVWQVVRPLDAGAMAKAAGFLLGRHDFSSFRAAGCQAKSPVKTLDRLVVERHGESILCTVEARSFLYHQVRNFVGSLKLVGEGRWQPDEVAEILAARDRRRAGPTAPARGLCLIAVRYPSALDPFVPSGQGTDETRREQEDAAREIDEDDHGDGLLP